MTEEDHLAPFQKKSIHNRSALFTAKICGCYYCLGEFEAGQVTEWVDDNDTALCPRCGIDAVLDFDTKPADKELLLKMHDRWFGNSRPKNWNGPPMRMQS